MRLAGTMPGASEQTGVEEVQELAGMFESAAIEYTAGTVEEVHTPSILQIHSMLHTSTSNEALRCDTVCVACVATPPCGPDDLQTSSGGLLTALRKRVR